MPTLGAIKHCAEDGAPGVGGREYCAGNWDRVGIKNGPGVGGAVSKIAWELPGSFFRGEREGRFAFFAGLADINAALEECAVFDADALGDDIAGEGAFAADVNTVAGGDVALYLAEHNDFAGGDAGSNLAIAANGNAVAGQVDGALNLAVNVEGFRTADLTFHDKRLTDGRLVTSRCRGGGSGRTNWGCFIG